MYIGASERHIPIVDDEGRNFFYIDGQESISRDAFFSSGSPMVTKARYASSHRRRGKMEDQLTFHDGRLGL